MERCYGPTISTTLALLCRISWILAPAEPVTAAIWTGAPPRIMSTSCNRLAIRRHFALRISHLHAIGSARRFPAIPAAQLVAISRAKAPAWFGHKEIEVFASFLHYRIDRLNRGLTS